MSLAKIVAALVERGEEDLAEELLQVRAELSPEELQKKLRVVLNQVGRALVPTGKTWKQHDYLKALIQQAMKDINVLGMHKLPEYKAAETLLNKVEGERRALTMRLERISNDMMAMVRKLPMPD